MITLQRSRINAARKAKRMIHGNVMLGLVVSLDAIPYAAGHTPPYRTLAGRSILPACRMKPLHFVPSRRQTGLNLC